MYYLIYRYLETLWKSLFNYNLILLLSKNSLCGKNVFTLTEMYCMVPNMIYLNKCSVCTEKNVYSAIVAWNSLYMPVAAAAAKSLQSCPTLCDLIDGSPLGSSVPGILQARTLERVDISFSSAWKWKVKVKSLSRAWLLATPWTAAYQAPPSMRFSRQEYWSGVPLPSPI